MSETKVTPPPSDLPKCPQCGTPLPTGALAGLCPACLLKMGAADDTVTDGKQPPFNPPSIAELAPKFPQLEILELIGKGGMGAVYKARQKQLDRIVALKILPPGIGNEPAFAERFMREARALAKLNHPNIVTLYEFGEASGQFYFLMEFVDGVNLRQLLNASRVSPHEALAIVPQICDALQFAHDQGIVHRDIKPENILMDRRGRVKVADFGLAKIIGGEGEPAVGAYAAGSTSLTDAGKVMGTPQYMSPEQIQAPGEVDHRADIYALGVVFYQMLTGELPGKKIEPPSKKVQIDVRLDEIVLRALEKNPELRFQQVSEVKTLMETIATAPVPEKSPNQNEPAQSFPKWLLWRIGFPKWPMRGRSATPGGSRREDARCSRTAIVGAGMAFLFLFLSTPLWAPVLWSLGTSSGHVVVGRSQIIFFLLMGVLGLLGAGGTTILGWVAVSQIRRSAGKIYGLGLAVFDGLLFPLLALDAIIFGLFWLVIKFLVVGPPGDMLTIGYQLGLFFALWLCMATIISALVDWLIIRRVWRAVNKNIVNVRPVETSHKNSADKTIAFASVALVAVFMFAMVLWTASAKRTAENQQQVRGALQIELGNKIAELLGNERRATYSSLTFEHVLNYPWRVVVHFGKLESWRDQYNEPLAQPRKIQGDVLLDFQPPNQWSATGTGDLTGAGGSWQTATPGFPRWPDSSVAATPAAVQKLSFGPVMERVISEKEANDQGLVFFDFETGNRLPPPFPLLLRPGQGPAFVELSTELLQWVKSNRMDALIQFTPTGWNVMNFRMQEDFIAQAADWDSVTADRVAELFAAKDAAGLVRDEVPASSFGHDFDDQRDDCKAFRTRSNTMGIMQWTGLKTAPHGVKIRYRLVQPDNLLQSHLASVHDVQTMLSNAAAYQDQVASVQIQAMQNEIKKFYDASTQNIFSAAEIEDVEILADRAIVKARGSDEAGLTIQFGPLTNRWTPSHIDSLFAVTLENHWLGQGVDWVVKRAHGNIGYHLDGPAGSSSGRIVFQPVTPVRDADGAWRIGEFFPDGGDPLPISVRLEKTGVQNSAAGTGFVATSVGTNSLPLAVAVNVFNARYASDAVGKTQPRLTEEEVLAAIRTALADRNTLLVSDATVAELGRVLQTRRLPGQFELEALTGYQPDDSTIQDVWSVRLRIPGGTFPNGTTCIRIREIDLGTRTIGPHERAIMERWRTNANSFERIVATSPMRIVASTYEQERKAAIAQDKAETR